VAHVFLSHSSSDTALADSVHRWLQDDGHEVFLDSNIRDGVLVGERWRKRLYDELSRIDAVGCLVTRAYVVSTWCTAEVRCGAACDVGAGGVARMPLHR